MQLVAPLPLQASAPVSAAPSSVRPYALAGARFRPAASAVVPRPRPVYDPVSQTARFEDGTALTTMATSQKTNQDGDINNPPPSDEGGDPGAIE
ncbi:putative ATP-grasp-modified RiPP [Streptomyces rhizosphaericus]|uniref:ATP-grasp-modified RiPP n=1 Tax=Streptomyces rhizosphaericus TaxID=114699 RepID=A0A6G4AED1_9ACTN|nr:putative ATP-grasp-modified RiPP [Streptomyces rhizosphaericus]NEW71685.1 putative ATP-grasp-modified RiPP [Streptomyces rhizosphaericus]